MWSRWAQTVWSRWAQKHPVGSGALSDGLHVRSVPRRALAPRVFEGAQPCWRCSQPRLPVFYLRRVHCGRRCTTWDCRRSRCSATAAAGVRPSAARFVLSAARFTGFDSAGHAVFAQEFGIVSYDWSNAKAQWAASKPMDCEERLLQQATMTKQLNPASHVFVYRNVVKASA